MILISNSFLYLQNVLKVKS